MLTPALLWPTARSVRWWPVLVPPLAGVALLQLVLDPDDPLDGTGLVRLLRVVTVLAAVGLAFLLDDPSSPTVAPVPVSLLRRRATRLALACPAVALWWLGVVASVRLWLPDTPWPVAALTLEAATVAVVGCAAAALAGRRSSERRGAVFAAPAVLALVGLTTVLPEPVALLVAPDDPGWAAGHVRWFFVLCVAVVCFLAASRDPARR
ncbi:hypothetical protein AB0M43_00885 [Longispora sp. NPDC051575]|uniref:hypothetical protein n=1 Tax=Longispora sp. NPDC051575 TaxID=3154943 RepID=UPI00344A84F6